MIEGLLGKKEGMTQVFTEAGEIQPVTVVQVGPCTVVQVKDEERDGYRALQIGFEPQKEKRTTKALAGHFNKAGTPAKKYLREVAILGEASPKVGEELTVSLFKDVKTVDVTGISKGKGFAGTIKRWNFSRGPMTHGSMNVRRPGSIGQASDPSRVFKGKRMAGRMGGKQVTVKNIKIVEIDEEKNLLLLKGQVPGPNKGLLLVKVSNVERTKQALEKKS